MAERYVSIDSERFEKFLSDKGFTRNISNTEIVYDRKHHRCSFITIRVCTSIRDGVDVARDKGQDAIRVIAFFNDEKGKSFGIAGRTSLSRVYRTGSEDKVFARTLERMQEAYKIANEWVKAHPYSINVKV